MSKMPNALSSNWRTNKSNNQVIELKNALESLTYIIGQISPNTEQVLYGGMTYNEGGEVIKIKLDLAGKEIPINPHDFDRMAGQAIHEAGHSITDIMQDHALSGPDYPGFSKKGFVMLTDEIYTDNYVYRHHPIHGGYVRKFRSMDEIASEEIKDYNKILDALLLHGVYGKKIDNSQVPSWMQPIYTIIESYVRELSTKNWDFFNRGCIADKVYSAIRSILSTEDLRKSLSTSQPTSFPALQRTQDRDKSLQLGEELLEKNTDLTDLDYDGNPISPGGQKETNYKEDILDSYAPHYEEPNSKNNVPYEDRAVPMLLKEISEALATNSEDMTAKVKEIATLGNECDNIIWRNANSDIITPNPERQLVKELEYLKNMRNALGRETTRSLPEGMVDRRRLGRIAVTNNIYKVNKRIPMKELDITLLLDRSSSMFGHMEIYDAAEALFVVLGKDIKILSYYSLSDTNIEIHNFDSKYRKIEPVGGTPSGLALLTTAIKYPKTLVIHFTDGDANNTIRPGEALDIIGDKYPSCQIINLLYKAKKELYNSKNPNSSIINLESIQEFPLKLKKIIEPILRHR